MGDARAQLRTGSSAAIWAEGIPASFYNGVVAPEVLTAHQVVAGHIPGAGLFAMISPDRVHRDWLVARSSGEGSIAERLLVRLPGAALVTVRDFHPATPSWLGAVAGNTIVPLGVDRFG